MNNDVCNVLKLRDGFEEQKEESEAQGKMLLLIQEMLEGLKANGGNLDNTAVKIERY